MSKLYKITEKQLSLIIDQKKITKQGYDAGMNGDNVKSCPYDKNTKEFNYWYDGWVKANKNENLLDEISPWRLQTTDPE